MAWISILLYEWELGASTKYRYSWKWKTSESVYKFQSSVYGFSRSILQTYFIQLENYVKE